jgi:hypothetical protein
MESGDNSRDKHIVDSAKGNNNRVFPQRFLKGERPANKYVDCYVEARIGA